MTTVPVTTDRPSPAVATVTHEQYGAAVAQLVRLVFDHPGTSGARAAAQVLLSTYNAYDFHLDITELCILDTHDEAAAWTVLLGRVQLREEPQECIENGNRLFEQLWQQFKHLANDQRHVELYGGAA